MVDNVLNSIKNAPVIAAINDKLFEKALQSPAKVIFIFSANVLTIKERIEKAHSVNKFLFVHIDLAEGIGKDKSGIEFLAKCGVDGIISTKSALIRAAKDCGLITIQRFFAYDSKGVNNISEVLNNSAPDLVEILPGVIAKIIKRFSTAKVPLIVGGLVDDKKEVLDALDLGAVAISTGKEDLWYI